MNLGGKKKSVPTDNRSWTPQLLTIIYREFWRSLPMPPFDHQAHGLSQLYLSTLFIC